MYRHPRSRPLCRKVYVGGLGNNGTVHEIGDAFYNYGPLRNVWVARNPPGFAFVEFEDPIDAQNAIAALDGTNLCGRRVRVAFANRNSRSSTRGQSRNAPTVNYIQDFRCFACGERGHYARDCLVRHSLAGLDQNDSYESDCSCFDSDDDMDMLRDMDEDDLYEYLQSYFGDRDHYYGSSSSSYQESPSHSSSSRTSPQQEHRNDLPHRARRNERFQEQRRNHEEWGPQRNHRPQEQHRNERFQEQRRNHEVWGPQHRNERFQEQRRNHEVWGPQRNDRPQEQHRNAEPQAQSRNSRSQEQHKNSQPQEQSKGNTPSSSKTNNASDEVKCVICLDTLEDEMEYIPCGHGFHSKCCNEWLSVNDICPICRTEVGSRARIEYLCPVS